MQTLDMARHQKLGTSCEQQQPTLMAGLVFLFRFEMLVVVAITRFVFHEIDNSQVSIGILRSVFLAIDECSKFSSVSDVSSSIISCSCHFSNIRNLKVTFSYLKV
jgi:hypothetical protein